MLINYTLLVRCYIIYLPIVHQWRSYIVGCGCGCTHKRKMKTNDDDKIFTRIVIQVHALCTYHPICFWKTMWQLSRCCT